MSLTLEIPEGTDLTSLCENLKYKMHQRHGVLLQTSTLDSTHIVVHFIDPEKEASHGQEVRNTVNEIIGV